MVTSTGDENLTIQYTANFSAVQIEKFIGKVWIKHRFRAHVRICEAQRRLAEAIVTNSYNACF